jgi:hypothetical protein
MSMEDLSIFWCLQFHSSMIYSFHCRNLSLSLLSVFLIKCISFEDIVTEIVFLNDFWICSLLVYRKATDFLYWFFILILYWRCLWYLGDFWWSFSGLFSIWSSHLLTGNLTSSFPIWILFISSSCLIALARNYKTILNKSGESEDYCLILDFRGNGFSFSSFSMISTMRLLYTAFLMLVTFLLFLVSSECLSRKNFVFCEKIICQDDHVGFVLTSVYMLYYVYWFTYIEQSLYPWNETDLIVVYELFDILLNSVCQYFNENFCIYVH